MALDFKNISVNLTQGVDVHDEVLTASSPFLKDVLFDDSDSLLVRDTAKTHQVQAGVRNLFTHQGTVLTSVDGLDGRYSAESRGLFSLSTDAAAVWDSAISGSLIAYAALIQRAGASDRVVVTEIYDVATGKLVASRQVSAVSVTSSGIRVLPTATGFVVAYLASGQIVYFAYTTSSNQFAGNFVFAGVGEITSFDVSLGPTRWYWAYSDDSEIVIIASDNVSTPISIGVLTNYPALSPKIRCVAALNVSSVFRLHVLHVLDGSPAVLSHLRLDSDLNPVFDGTALDVSSESSRIGGVALLPAATVNATIVVDIINASNKPAPTSITNCGGVRAYSLGNTATLVARLFAGANALASRGFVYNGHGCVMVATQRYRNDANAATLMLVPVQRQSDGGSLYGVLQDQNRVRIWARLAPEASGLTYRGYSPGRRLASIPVSGTKAYISHPTVVLSDDVPAGDGTQRPTHLLTQHLVDYTSSLGFAEASGLTYLAGAVPQVYDGRVTVEQDFNMPPDIDVHTVTPAVGPLAAGSYSFCLTWVWTDSQGNTHESAPGTPLTLTVNANDRVTFQALGTTTLRRDNVRLQLYRTVVNPPAPVVFYRDNSIDATTLTNNGVITAASDANLIKAEALPSSTGRLVPAPMPPHKSVVVHDNRLWLSNCDEPGAVYYTQALEPNFAAEFNALYRRDITPSAGRVANCASVDDKLVVLAEAALGALGGSGPGFDGSGDGYSQIQITTSDYGCALTGAQAVVVTDDGVWFPSSNAGGVRCFGRSLRILRNQEGRDVGSESDSILAPPLGSGPTNVTVCAGKLRQMVFFAGDQRMAVYDTSFRQWTEFSLTARAMVFLPSGIYFTPTNGTDVLVWNGLGSEGGDAVSTWVVETGWIALAQIGGLQRITHLQMLVGGYTNSGTLLFTAKVYTDWDDKTPTQTVSSFNPGSTQTIVGSRSNTYAGHAVSKAEIQLARQQCEAIKFVFSGVGSGTQERRARLSNMALRAGLKRGRTPLAGTRRF